MKYQIGDLLRYSFDAEREGYHYAVVLNINNDGFYRLHWLDIEGNPNSEYIIDWYENEIRDNFDRIS